MNIKKQHNYIKFGNEIEELTGCDVRYEALGDKHVHYELSSKGISLGILCYCNEELSFAPFRSFDNRATNEEFIYFKHAPSFDEFTRVLTKLGTLVLD